MGDRPGRPGWWAVVSCVFQAMLMGSVTVLLVACVLLGAIWHREGSPNLLAYLLRGERKPKASLLVSTPGTDEWKTNSSGMATPPAGTESPLAPLPETQSSEARAIVSSPEATPGGQEGPSSSSGGLPANQERRGLVASLPERPATRIVISAIGIDAPVEMIPIRDGTWDVEQITHEVGHLQGTASPGDSSNVVLAGHITLTAGGYGPFRGLAQLQPDDEIQIYVGDQKVYVYKVDSVKTVEATDVEVTYPTTEPILTLITCVNWDPVQGRYNDRLVVVAHLGG